MVGLRKALLDSVETEMTGMAGAWILLYNWRHHAALSLSVLNAQGTCERAKHVITPSQLFH